MMYAPFRTRAVARGQSAGLDASGPVSLTGAQTERLARTVVAVATVWFAVALSWGLFGPVGAGHEAIVASRGIVADNILAWHMWGPVRQYTLEPPGVDLIYAHHPFGSFWLIAGLAKLLGRHAFVPRLVPILLSTATVPLLYGIGRALWAPIPGALAALTYTVLPITLAFGNFPGFEVPVTFGCLLMTWGYLRFVQHWEPRWMVVSLLGVAFAANADWETNVFFGVVLGGLGAAALFVPHRVFGRVRERDFMRWWGLCVAIAAATLLAYAVFLARSGAINNLLSEAGKRSRGNDTPIKYVLESRGYWINVTFTPLAVLVGKMALPLLLVRLLLLRQVLEIFPIALWAMAAFQYLAFKNGADVHIYWPMPFAPYCALSVGVLAETGFEAARWLWERSRGERMRSSARAIVALTFGLIPLAILPDGVRALRYAHVSGGRFNEKGRIIFRDLDKIAALEWMRQRMQPGTVVLAHESMHPTWAQDWALHTPLKRVFGIPNRSIEVSERYFLADMRFLSADDQKHLAAEYHVVAVGPYLLVDRREPPAPVDGYSFSEREPNPIEWYFLSGTDPIRTVRPDRWYTWELRDQYGQTPNEPPTGEPSTPEELRVAHNVAVANGDAARADEYERALLSQLRVSVSMPFDDGTSLLGEQFRQGVAPTLALYFRSIGPARKDLQFRIDSIVQAMATFSIVPADPAVRQVGEPFWLPPRGWKPGFIYAVRSENPTAPRHRAFRRILRDGGKGAQPAPCERRRFDSAARPALSGAGEPRLVTPRRYGGGA